jgi:hypothetical protein
MSGGSHNYVYFRIQEIDVISTYNGQDIPSSRVKFQELLKLVSKAMYDIERVDSCDMSNGDELEAIEAVFAFCKTANLK